MNFTTQWKMTTSIKSTNTQKEINVIRNKYKENNEDKKQLFIYIYIYIFIFGLSHYKTKIDNINN